MMVVPFAFLKKHAKTMKAMSGQIHLIQHDLRHFVHMQFIFLDHGDMDGMREALSSLLQHIKDSLESHLLGEYTGQLFTKQSKGGFSPLYDGS